MEWQAEIKSIVSAYANTEEEAKEALDKLATEISNSSNSILESYRIPRSMYKTDDNGNRLHYFINEETGNGEYYVPMCPYGYIN